MDRKEERDRKIRWIGRKSGIGEEQMDRKEERDRRRADG